MLSAFAFSGLFGQEDGLDVGQDTALSDGDSLEKLVQLFVVSDGQLKMTRVVVAWILIGLLDILSESFSLLP